MSFRFDNVSCKLDDHVGSLSGDASYKRATGRVGVTWNPLSDFGLYASWGTGFLPPGTEELANNPSAFGGFNRDLKPALSNGEEIGARGSIGPSLVYDLALFHLATDNDFGRYRMASRPLETFYGNVGSTARYGLETYLAWYPFEPLAFRLSYTYSHFKYDTVQTFDAAGTYSGTWLPNSPQHQLYLDGEYKITSALTAGASLEYVSSWYIDSTNRVFPVDPVLYPAFLTAAPTPTPSSTSASATNSRSAGRHGSSFSPAGTFSALNTTASPSPTRTAIRTSPRRRRSGRSACASASAGLRKNKKG